MAQEKPIRNYVLPLVEVSKYAGGLKMEQFHGTCFLVGDKGYALTNKHLLGTSGKNMLCAMVIDGENRWRGKLVLESESHPEEDLAILKLSDIDYGSFMKVSDRSEHSSFTYMQWSYPDEIVQELVENNKVLMRPDLVYLEGYVRRRITDIQLDGIKGRSFYELSEPGTIGCSGSPVLAKNNTGQDWMLIGVFVGNRSTTFREELSSVGYAVRMDAVKEWVPRIAKVRLTEL